MIFEPVAVLAPMFCAGPVLCFCARRVLGLLLTFCATAPSPCPATPHLDPRAVGRCLRLWHCTSSSLPGVPFCRAPRALPCDLGAVLSTILSVCGAQNIPGCMRAACPAPRARKPPFWSCVTVPWVP
jgi:hypothetical protein